MLLESKLGIGRKYSARDVHGNVKEGTATRMKLLIKSVATAVKNVLIVETNINLTIEISWH